MAAPVPDLAARRGGWRPGITTRSALAAVAVVAVALLVAAPLAVWFFHRSLLQEAEQVADLRAQQLSTELSTDGVDGVRALLARSQGERSVAQVVTGGQVVAASPGVEGLPPLSGTAVAAGGRTTTVERPPDPNDPDDFLVVSRGVRVEGQRYRVLVGDSLETVDRATRTVESAMAVGLPGVLLVVGAATYLFVGRSLRPVEAIRARVARISSQDLDERFPEPAVHDEVGRLALTMNDMLERLRSAQQAQYRFVADASHELRSPLATLRSTLEVSLAHPSTRTTANTEAMLSETERLQRLVDDLVLLARADEDPRTPQEEVDLDDLARSERNRVRATTRLAVGGSLDPARVLGSSHQLAQVVRNLVDNAVHHAQTRVSVQVRTEDAGTRGDVAVLEVADDGPGVAPADRDRVFDRFVRLDEARSRHHGGSGLGLAIVDQIVRRHGGTVTVADGPLGGALFTVRLPVGGRGAQPPAGSSR